MPSGFPAAFALTLGLAGCADGTTKGSGPTGDDDDDRPHSAEGLGHTGRRWTPARGPSPRCPT
jgi:hypothetical protein